MIPVPVAHPVRLASLEQPELPACKARLGLRGTARTARTDSLDRQALKVRSAYGDSQELLESMASRVRMEFQEAPVFPVRPARPDQPDRKERRAPPVLQVTTAKTAYLSSGLVVRRAIEGSLDQPERTVSRAKMDRPVQPEQPVRPEQRAQQELAEPVAAEAVDPLGIPTTATRSTSRRPRTRRSKTSFSSRTLGPRTRTSTLQRRRLRSERSTSSGSWQEAWQSLERSPT